MVKKNPALDQDTYEREFAPLLWAIAEKAWEQHCSCLVAVEVDGVIHISGKVIGDSPRMIAAYEILFEEEEKTP